MGFNELFEVGARRHFLCTRCLETIRPTSGVRGSFLIELGLWATAIIWLPLILLGILYSVWRMTTRRKQCPRCSSTELVPSDSERARRLLGS